MSRTNPDTNELVERAASGEKEACEQLLMRHKDRLRRMVAVRMDPRLAARVDPSDVVQETLASAWGRLPTYLRLRPLPFYPWLRQIALERLTKLRLRHIHAQKRSVQRENGLDLSLSRDSVAELARQLRASGTSPSAHAMRDEIAVNVREALAKLSSRDREILVLRFLERLSTREIAAVLEITEGAVKVRAFRALQRLRALLGDEIGEEGQ